MTTIVEVPPPVNAGDPNTWAALAEAALWNAELLAELGYADLNDPEATAVTMAVPSSTRRTLRWVALDDPDDHDSVVGAVSCSLTLKDNLSVAGVHGIVRPDRRRQGIGTRLFDEAERRAQAEGRSTLQSWVSQVGSPKAEGPGVLAPTEGSGYIDGTRPSPAFMLGRGYVLEQVEVHSMLRVPVPSEVLEPLAGAAARRVGDDYDLVSWLDRCPDELLDAFARLRVAMIDAPSGGVEQEAAYWDADRVREVEGRWNDGGVDTVTTAARHTATGELAGYTQLIRFRERPDSAIQEDTVVIAGHRGHRLGMHLKIANLRLVAEHWPAVRRIHTWNADENDYMRSINIALGFRPESNEGAWQKVVG